MGSIVGFIATFDLTEDRLTPALAAQRRALFYFPHLERLSLTLGKTNLELWGHKPISDRVHSLADGSVLVLIGSPHGEVSWCQVEKVLVCAERPEDFALLWEGRVILLRVSADGKQWTMWNDWIGSIPVFHVHTEGWRICSTLEPAVVAAAGFRADDIFLPGMISLLINGHFLADWTLYKGMKTIPPDCAADWEGGDFRCSSLCTVRPSQDRWETGWDDLVEEMYELSRQAVADVLKTRPDWILPLSGGLDSRLIAAVAAELGTSLSAYAWGSPQSTDVVCSRQVAHTLGLPWMRVELGTNYLAQYAPRWADLFGSGMHFHGMYQMAFLDRLAHQQPGSVLSGFMGDPLAGSHLAPLISARASAQGYQLMPGDYSHWNIEEVRSLVRSSSQDGLAQMIEEIARQTNAVAGAWFQRIMVLDFWTRQRSFIQFHPILCDYWRGVATPFLNRAYARFCLSLPRTALEDRRLQKDMYRRHYGVLATIPGTYATEPLIRTGRYLLKRRIARVLPMTLRRGPFGGFDEIALRMDIDCVQAAGHMSLWPIHAALHQLKEWLDVTQLDTAYLAVMANKDDIRPLRKLQSVQALAYRLLGTSKVDRETVDDALSPVFERI